MPKVAELIVTNGRIATMDRMRPFVSAAAMEGGRFILAGTDEEVMAARGAGTRVIDLGGRTAIPGLIDSHLHLIRGGLNYNLELRWDGVPSLYEALGLLKEQARRTPYPQWVRVVGGWSEFQFAERRMPTLEEINAAAPDTPVFVLHLYDRAFLNGAALRAVGYTKDTPEPPGGEIQRDAPELVRPGHAVPSATRTASSNPIGRTSGNNRAAASSRTIVSFTSPSIKGRAIDVGTDVTNPHHSDDSRGVRTGTVGGLVPGINTFELFATNNEGQPVATLRVARAWTPALACNAASFPVAGMPVPNTAITSARPAPNAHHPQAAIPNPVRPAPLPNDTRQRDTRILQINPRLRMRSKAARPDNNLSTNSRTTCLASQRVKETLP